MTLQLEEQKAYKMANFGDNGLHLLMLVLRVQGDLSPHHGRDDYRLQCPDSVYMVLEIVVLVWRLHERHDRCLYRRDAICSISSSISANFCYISCVQYQHLASHDAHAVFQQQLWTKPFLFFPQLYLSCTNFYSFSSYISLPEKICKKCIDVGILYFVRNLFCVLCASNLLCLVTSSESD